MNETMQKVAGAMLAIQATGIPGSRASARRPCMNWGTTRSGSPWPTTPSCARRSTAGLAVINENVAVTDPAANGEVCLRAYALTGDEFYRDGAQRARPDYLMKDAPRTDDGVLYRNTVSFAEGFSPNQLWIDAAYMAPPFLAVMGELDEAARQLRGYFRYLQDPGTRLFFHNYDVGTGKFVRRLRWATGNGWALMGIARVAAEAKKCGRLDILAELTARGNEVLESLVRFQLPDGRFRDIVDDENSFVDGTSAMMMSVYIYRGVLDAWIHDGAMVDRADRALATVQSKVDRFGIVREVCGCPHFVLPGHQRRGAGCAADGLCLGRARARQGLRAQVFTCKPRKTRYNRVMTCEGEIAPHRAGEKESACQGLKAARRAKDRIPSPEAAGRTRRRAALRRSQ